MENRLKEIRKNRHLTQVELAAMAGVSQGAIQKLENGKVQMGPKWIKKISEALNITPYELMSLDIKPNNVTSISVVGYVQAGLFQEANQWDKGNFYTVNPPIMPEYEGNSLFALEVRGDSMDKVYPEGTCIICVPVAEVGMPSSGKRVVCARNLPDGTVEATVKEYRETDSGIYLIPHSTNPTYVPYRLDDGLYGECEIVAIVIGSFRRE